MRNNILISPAKITILKHSKKKGKFLIKPLSPGFGITIGNSLRRVLISSLEGYAISSIMIHGVTHEFSYIDGVIENLTEIILNLKQIRLKLNLTTSKKIPEYFTICLNQKQSKITAGDLCGSIHCFEVLNPNLFLFTKELDTNLNITLGIKKGIGYVPVEKNLKKKIGQIPIDTIFSPIRNVRLKVETCEVKNYFDFFESLILEIRTDGSITPKKALKKASSILSQHLTVFFKGKKKEETTSDIDEAYENDDIDGTDISVLKTWGELVKIKTWAELVKVKKLNFGMKSFEELKKIMKHLGLDLGLDYVMDLSKNKSQISKKKKRIINFREKMRKIVKLRNVIKRRKQLKMINPNPSFARKKKSTFN